jgi:hypothetical protein
MKNSKLIWLASAIIIFIAIGITNASNNTTVQKVCCSHKKNNTPCNNAADSIKSGEIDFLHNIPFSLIVAAKII